MKLAYKFFIFTSIVAVSGFFIFTTPIVYAEDAVSTSSTIALKAERLNKISATNIPDFIGSAIQIVMGIVGSIALAMIVYGGFLMMLSAGNAERSKKGRDILIWSALGVFVILASYSLVRLVLDIF